MKSVCLNMIVKDEKNVIQECLQSVKPLIDYWVIVDTGSSDGTQAIIKKCMHGLPGKLFERPWVHFAHNRNEAIDLAKNKGDYLLFLDADEKLIHPKGFVWPALQMDCYVATGKYYKQEDIEFGRILLINNHLEWEWAGVVHEEIRGRKSQPRKGAMLHDISILTDLGGARSKDPKKTMKDALLLESALKEDPKNSRYVFYLALSYDVAKETHPALKNYLKRSVMDGNDGEIFYSLYRIARLQESIGLSPEIIMDSYRKAYQFRPSRAEPLYYLAKFIMQKRNYSASYKILKSALSIPYPKDQVFVESSIYQYDALWLFAECSFHLQHYQETYQVFLQLLSIQNLPIEYRTQLENLLPQIKTLSL